MLPMVRMEVVHSGAEDVDGEEMEPVEAVLRELPDPEHGPVVEPLAAMTAILNHPAVTSPTALLGRQP